MWLVIQTYAWIARPCSRRFHQGIAKKLIIRIRGKDGLAVVAALDDVLRCPETTWRGRRAMAGLRKWVQRAVWYMFCDQCRVAANRRKLAYSAEKIRSPTTPMRMRAGICPGRARKK